MSLIRRRKRDREIADARLAETEQRIIDLAARRARLEAEVEVALYAMQRRERGPNDRSG